MRKNSRPSRARLLHNYSYLCRAVRAFQRARIVAESSNSRSRVTLRCIVETPSFPEVLQFHIVGKLDATFKSTKNVRTFTEMYNSFAPPVRVYIECVEVSHLELLAFEQSYFSRTTLDSDVAGASEGFCRLVFARIRGSSARRVVAKPASL